MGGEGEKEGEASSQDSSRASVGKYINRGQAGDGEGVQEGAGEEGGAAGQTLEPLRWIKMTSPWEPTPSDSGQRRCAADLGSYLPV